MLEVVTEEELSDLAILSESYRRAEEDVRVDIREGGIWDSTRCDHSEDLRQARDDARQLWQARWVEIFE